MTLKRCSRLYQQAGAELNARKQAYMKKREPLKTI